VAAASVRRLAFERTHLVAELRVLGPESFHLSVAVSLFVGRGHVSRSSGMPDHLSRSLTRP
jgi:hypothetical protein